jgi:GNAT superfamily N-acetyltransferase
MKTPSQSASPQIEMRHAQSAKEIDQIRVLMREYGAYLAANPTGAANICISGYEAELDGLPAPYVAPGSLILALVDGEAAGCVALKQLRPKGVVEADGDAALELKRLWVRAEFRGLGLGRKLMQAAIDHARASGATSLYLDTVRAAMPEANRLYEAMGFVQVPRYNENPVDDVIFFCLDLQPAVSGIP